MDRVNVSSSSVLQAAFSSGIPLKTIPISGQQLVSRCLFTTVCVIVNLVVIIVIVCSRQLHLPRHTYLAGSSVVILIGLADWMAEVFITLSDGDPSVCLFYEVLAPVWYPTLLLFISLAGLDRYLAIEHYEWYQRKMTNKRAVLAMLIGSTLTAITFDSPFWTGHLLPSDCLFDLTHANVISTWSALLGVANIVLQVKIFIVLRKAIHDYFAQPAVCEEQSFHVAFFKDVLHVQSDYLFHPGGLRNENVAGSQHYIPWPNKPLIARLDFRAALVLLANVLSFWLCTFPFVFNIMTMHWCARLELECSVDALMMIDVYAKFTFVVPCVYMPIVYMLSSSEFKRAIQHQAAKVKSRIHNTAAHQHRSVPPVINSN